MHLAPRSAVELLVGLAAPGGPPPAAVHWPAVQDGLGSVLPSDYKTLVGVLGPFVAGDQLTVFAPGAHLPALDLREQVGWQLGALCALKGQLGEAVCPYPLWFEPGGLLPWGRTHGGAVLFWRTQGGPDEWTVVAGDRGGPLWEAHPMPCASFLAEWLGGRLRSAILPSPAPGAAGLRRA